MIHLHSIWKRWRASRLRTQAESLIIRAFGMTQLAKELQKQADTLDADADAIDQRARETAR